VCPAVLYIGGSPTISTYTRNEELANTITHGVGIALAVAGTIILTLRAFDSADIWRIVSYPLFGLTMVLLYVASTVYHGHPDDNAKPRLKKFDHISIYYLIAGTYTPVTLVALRGPWGWSLFGVVWGLALAGTVYKLLFTGRFPVVSTALYVGMGWMAVAAVVPLIRNVPGPTLLWLLAGGLFYTGGVGFYLWRRLPFNHAIWHLFVLGGTASHFVLVMKL
jgi:hemolysin III